jgi:hypothetical protein
MLCTRRNCTGRKKRCVRDKFPVYSVPTRAITIRDGFRWGFILLSLSLIVFDESLPYHKRSYILPTPRPIVPSVYKYYYERQRLRLVCFY